jgi:hypothetical protein
MKKPPNAIFNPIDRYFEDENLTRLQLTAASQVLFNLKLSDESVPDIDELTERLAIAHGIRSSDIQRVALCYPPTLVEQRYLS